MDIGGRVDDAFLVRAVNELDPKAHLHESDAIPYSSTAPKLNDVWQLYAERFWN